ncbi:MAG: hypothetical protein CMI36_10665 [Owenweeksia sp.]|nr:hypothetical protein [Owenweeksia sp.]MBF99444.1 hypothetical protein [Owenweeksia sp.]
MTSPLVLAQVDKPEQYKEGENPNSYIYTQKQAFTDTVTFTELVKLSAFRTGKYSSEEVGELLAAWQGGEFTSVPGGFTQADSLKVDSLWNLYTAGELGTGLSLQQVVDNGDSLQTASSGGLRLAEDYSFQPGGRFIVSALIETNTTGTSSDWWNAKNRLDSLIASLETFNLQIIGNAGSSYKGDNSFSWFYNQPEAVSDFYGSHFQVTQAGIETNVNLLHTDEAESASFKAGLDGFYHRQYIPNEGLDATFRIQDNRAVLSLPNPSEFGGVFEYGGDYSERYTDRSLVDKAYVDQAAGDGSGSVSFDGNRPITLAVNGLQGVNPGTDDLRAWIEEVFYPSEPPSVSLTLSYSGVTTGADRTLEYDDGSTQTGTFNWTLTRAATTSSINQLIINGTPLTFTQPAQGATVNGTADLSWTSNQESAFTLSATTSDGKSASDVFTIAYARKMYWGFASSLSPTEAEIHAMQQEFSPPGKVHTLLDKTAINDCGSCYFYIILEEALDPENDIQIWVNGLKATGAFVRNVQSFRNASGETSDYVFYRSNSQQNSDITFEILN